MPALVVLLAIALPWLNPFSFGPSPAVMPWLFTLACLAPLLWLAPRVRLDQVAPAAWLLAALLSSLLGLLQYFGATAVFGPWVNSTAMGEAYGNLRQRNQFATLTNMGLAVLLWWALPGDAARPVRYRWRQVALALAAVLLGLGNGASSSRTGLLQLLVLLLLVGLWGSWRQVAVRRTLLLALLAYGVAALTLPLLAGLDPRSIGIFARLQDGTPGCASRLTLWHNVLHLIAQKPWWGWGWGELDYAHFITLYPGPRFCEILDNAHNLPLHFAVELGLPLALGVCSLLAWTLWRTKPWTERNAPRQMAWAVLALIGLHSLLEYPLWYGPFQVAATLCCWRLWRAPPRALVTPVSRLVVPLTALVLIASAGYAAWDYHRISQIYLPPEKRAPTYRNNTLAKIDVSVLFQNQVRFAELGRTPLTPDNAAHSRALALDLLHFSPEPRVVQALITSARLLGRYEEAAFYAARYQAAFPASYLLWEKGRGR
jgi:O-antigen ligase